MGPPIVFYNILEWKNAFLGYKKKKFKTRKIDIFPKGLTHGIRQKLNIFRSFHLRQYRPEKRPLRYSRTKNAFLGYKNKKFKKSNNSKGSVHGFWVKLAIFVSF